MHELGVASEIARIASEEAAAAGARRVTALRLRVGAWSGIETESLRFAFQAICEGTLLEGCVIEIEPVAPEFRCTRCAKTFEAEGHFDPCPHCGELGIEMIAGDELTLAEIDVEDE